MRIKKSILLAIMTIGPDLCLAQSGNIDTHVAVNDIEDPNTYVVIISNENYQFEEKVPYAINDGQTFALYCEKTLGVCKKNIKFFPDATMGVMKRSLSLLESFMKMKNGEGRAIIYYSGHGMPDEASKKAYLLPVDGFSTDPSTGMSTESLYAQLGSLPSKGTLVFLDACFSGAKRDGGMMKSSRGVAIKAKDTPVADNLVVFSAAQGNETAHPLKSKEHGMFTYYLLEELQKTGGGVTLGELSDYVTKQVSEASLRENEKSQTPSVAAGGGIDWRNWKMAEQAATNYVNFPKVMAASNQPKKVEETANAVPRQQSTLDMSAGGAFSLAGVTVEMIRIDDASFTMGDQSLNNTFSTFSMNMPVHQVTLKAYAIGKTEVTQALWETVMGNNPSQNKGAGLPVENVSWDDCQQFLKKLNSMCGTNFRLPTEAEWEYAASCGHQFTAIGLKAMTDGVDEWCHDFYARYTQMNQNNPKGPSMGFQRTVRGASGLSLSPRERITQRGHMKQQQTSPRVGLRLAHDI